MVDVAIYLWGAVIGGLIVWMWRKADSPIRVNAVDYGLDTKASAEVNDHAIQCALSDAAYRNAVVLIPRGHYWITRIGTADPVRIVGE
jgi:hypothetical protein